MRAIPGITVLILSGWIATGCVLTGQTSEPMREREPCSADRSAELVRENAMLRDAAASDAESLRRLEQRIAELRIEIIKNKAIISDYSRRFDHQQKRLDAAILEVVRAKEKLRSHESKAEAASTLAEAEIALAELKRQATPSDQLTKAEIEDADHLLSLSVNEYKSRNFGGALYLANQTKNQVRDAQIRIDRRAKRSVIEGESFFLQPLSLLVLKNSNLREGPSLNDEIIGNLNRDEAVIGHSFKENWIHVETAAGQTGWVFQSLVRAP